MDVCFNSLSTVGGTPNNPSESKKPLSLFELPTEVVTKAVELLPPSDLAAVSLTCTRGRDIAEDILCRRATQYGWGTEKLTPSKAIGYLESVYRGVHSLKKENLLPTSALRFNAPTKKRGRLGFKKTVRLLNVESTLSQLSRTPFSQLAEAYCKWKCTKANLLDRWVVTRALYHVNPLKVPILFYFDGNRHVKLDRSVVLAGVDKKTQEQLDHALFKAVGRSDLFAGLMFLGRGADPNFVDPGGWSPLTINTSNPQVTELLLACGADINYQHLESQETALHIAAKNGHLRTVQVLIDYQANLNLKDKEGNTPLHLAASAAKGRVALALLEAGADCNVLNNEGYYPTWYNYGLRVDNSFFSKH